LKKELEDKENPTRLSGIFCYLEVLRTAANAITVTSISPIAERTITKSTVFAPGASVGISSMEEVSKLLGVVEVKSEEVSVDCVDETSSEEAGLEETGAFEEVSEEVS
jgi:hypothetical protein